MNSETTQGQPDVANPETSDIAATVETTVPERTQVPKPKGGRKPKCDVTLGDLCERYIRDLGDRQGRSPGTCSSYTAELKLAIKHLGTDTPIASITPAQVGEFFESKPVTKLRSGKKKSQLSVDKTRRVLRLALCYAAEKKLIPSVPLPEPTGEQA